MIDPTLALQGTQQPNFLAQLANLQKMQGAQQQQQIQATDATQRQDENGVKLQAMHQGAQDDSDYRAATAAAMDPNTGQVDRGTLISTLAKLNPTVAARTSANLASQDTAAAEAKVKLTKAQLDTASTHLDFMDKLFQGVTDPVTYANAAKLAAANGVNPQEIPPTYDPSWVAQQHQRTLTMKDQLAQHMKEREADRADQTQAETEDNSAAQRDQAAAQLAQTTRNQNAELGIRRGELGVQQGRLAMEKKKGDVDQGVAIEAMAQQVASADVKKPTITRNNPFNEAVLKRAYEINPGLTDEAYTTKQDYLSSKGKANANLQSFNKVAEHLHDVREASDDAGFTPFGITGAGHALATAQQVFGTEDVKYLAGSGVASEGELNKLHSNINSSVESVRTAALDQLEKMTASAGRQIGANYERGTKQPFDQTRFFNPQAQGILQRHGEPSSGGPTGGGKITVTAPDGSTHPFDTQAQADTFKRLAGIR